MMMHTTRSDLLEIIDNRAAHKTTTITSQQPVPYWLWIGDAAVPTRSWAAGLHAQRSP